MSLGKHFCEVRVGVCKNVCIARVLNTRGDVPPGMHAHTYSLCLSSHLKEILTRFLPTTSFQSVFLRRHSAEVVFTVSLVTF